MLTSRFNESGVYLNPGVNYLFSPVQSRIASVTTSVYQFDSMVRGQHVYKSVWSSLTDWCSKICKCIPVQEDNKHDKYAINHRL